MTALFHNLCETMPKKYLYEEITTYRSLVLKICKYDTPALYLCIISCVLDVLILKCSLFRPKVPRETHQAETETHSKEISHLPCLLAILPALQNAVLTTRSSLRRSFFDQQCASPKLVKYCRCRSENKESIMSKSTSPQSAHTPGQTISRRLFDNCDSINAHASFCALRRQSSATMVVTAPQHSVPIRQ